MNTTTINILKSLDILSTLIQAFYEIGYELGTFYRNHLHSHVKFAIEYSGLVIRETYDNRQEYFTKLNNFRNQAGSYFVYSV